MALVGQPTCRLDNLKIIQEAEPSFIWEIKTEVLSANCLNDMLSFERYIIIEGII